MMMMMKNRTSLWSICLKTGANKVEAQLSGEDRLHLFVLFYPPIIYYYHYHYFKEQKHNTFENNTLTKINAWWYQSLYSLASLYLRLNV